MCLLIPIQNYHTVNLKSNIDVFLPSVQCSDTVGWLGLKKLSGGVLERGADLHTAQLMPLPLTVCCFSKIQIGFTFLVPAYPGKK